MGSPRSPSNIGGSQAQFGFFKLFLQRAVMTNTSMVETAALDQESTSQLHRLSQCSILRNMHFSESYAQELTCTKDVFFGK